GVLPFWYWLIALFFIALIHEFGHAVVAMAHKIKLDSTGIAFIGPIIGAFVEPNNKQMSKQSDIVKYSVMAAGPFFNFLLAALAILLLKFAFFPLQEMMVEQDGFTFSEYVNESYPAAVEGLPLDTAIMGIDGIETTTFYDFAEVLTCKSPGDQVTVSSFDEEGNEKDYILTLISNPDDESKGFMGINSIQNNVKVKEPYTSGIGEVAYYTLDWFNGMSNGGKGFFFWLYLLSLGIGMFNLLPLGITDGGQMLQLTLSRTHGIKKGNKRFKQVSLLFLVILLLNLILPFAKNLIMSLI
ncbi:site-2 protease family protein, partial [archaeon]|nr:site-2 protease family protein [archaeon]